MRTATMLEAPDVGFYNGMNPHTYHSIDALGQSEMKEGIDGTMHDFRAALDAPPPEDSTASMIRGSLFGLALFQPAKYATMCVDGPKHSNGKYVGKFYGVTSDEYKNFARDAQKAGLLVVGGDDRALITRMVAAVHAHPLASKFLHPDLKGEAESVAIWDEPIPGVRGASVRSKAAFDWNFRHAGGRHRVELKSAKSLNRGEWSRQINQLGYHIQAAWYRRAFRAVCPQPVGEEYVLVAQNCEPFGVAVDVIGDASIKVANTLIDEFLVKYHTAKNSNPQHWPGHGWSPLAGEDGQGAYEPRTIDVPKYALGNYADGD